MSDPSKLRGAPDERADDPFVKKSSRAEARAVLAEPVESFDIAEVSAMSPQLKKVLALCVYAVKSLAEQAESIIALEHRAVMSIHGKSVPGTVRIIGTMFDKSGAPRKIILGFYSDPGHITMQDAKFGSGGTTDAPWLSLCFESRSPVKVTANTLGTAVILEGMSSVLPFKELTDTDDMGHELNFLGNQLLNSSSAFENKAGVTEANGDPEFIPVTGLSGEAMIPLGDGLSDCSVHVDFESFNPDDKKARVCTIGVRSKDQSHWLTISYSSVRDAVVVGGSDLSSKQIKAIINAVAEFVGISLDRARTVPVRRMTAFGTTEATASELEAMKLGLSVKAIKALMDTYVASFASRGVGTSISKRVVTKRGEYAVVVAPHQYQSTRPNVGFGGVTTTYTVGVLFQFAPVADPNKLASVFIPNDAFNSGTVRFSGRVVNVALFNEIFLESLKIS